MRFLDGTDRNDVPADPLFDCVTLHRLTMPSLKGRRSRQRLLGSHQRRRIRDGNVQVHVDVAVPVEADFTGDSGLVPHEKFVSHVQLETLSGTG